MSDTATAPPPTTPPYVVSRISPIGNHLYMLAVLLPSGHVLNVIIPFSSLTLELVSLSVEAIRLLHETKDGATPALRPFP